MNTRERISMHTLWIKWGWQTMITYSQRCPVVYRSYIIALYVLSGYAYFRVGRKCQSGFILRIASHVRLGFTSARILFSPYSRRWDMISVFLPPGFASRFVCPFMISRTSVKERAGTAESPGDTTESRVALWLSIFFFLRFFIVKTPTDESVGRWATLEMIRENNVF